jgi:hypothetical protein
LEGAFSRVSYITEEEEYYGPVLAQTTKREKTVVQYMEKVLRAIKSPDIDR